MAGELMLARARETGARLLPIDSEHCALHQCLAGRRPEDVRRLLLTASGGPFRNRPRESFMGITPRGGARAPDLAHGAQDHDRLGDAHEQGPRGDRGALAVRRARGQDRRADPPAVGGALDGGARRRHGAGAARGHRHADADPVRAQPSRDVAGAHPRDGLQQAARARVRAARPRALPVSRARLPGARDRAARPRRRSTPPTRRPWRPSSTAGRRSSPFPRPSRRSSRREPRTPAATLEDVLEADARARERARQALTRRTPARVH